MLGTALCAIALSTLSACGPAEPATSQPERLLDQGPGPISPRQLEAARAAAARFANAYARSIYRPHPGHLSAADPAVTRTLAAAAERVPPGRLGLRPRAAGLRLVVEGPTEISAAIEIADGRSPRFSVGFGLDRRGGRWRVTSISPPG